MFDPHGNLVRVTVTVAPTTPTAGTTIKISDADAAILDAAGLNPSTNGAFNASVHPLPNSNPTATTEIVRLTAKGASFGGDTQYTITRQAESGGVNRSIVVGDKITITFTKKNIVDIEQNVMLSGMSKQAVMNGNFNIWQRAVTKTNPGSTEILADRWRISYANSGTLPTSIIHSRQAITPGDIANAFYHYRITTNGAGSGFATGNFYLIRESIENGTRLLAGLNKKITIAFYAKSSIAGKKIGIGIQQEYGTGGSPSAADISTGQVLTLTSSWVKYSYTFTLATLVGKTFGTNNDDALVLFLFTMWGSTIGISYLNGAAAETFVGAGDIDIAQVQINAGDIALDFQPKTFEEELRECQRYFAKSYDYAIIPGTIISDGVDQAVGIGVIGRPIVRVQFPVRMRAIPTVHAYSPSTGVIDKLRDASASVDMPASYLYLGQGGGQMFDPASTVASGNHVLVHWTADAEF